MSNSVKYIEINQPIGTMYLVKLQATIVAKISATNTRKAYNDNHIKEYKGIQRKLEINRVYAIADYCSTKDAMFPTPIILSAPSDKFKIDTKNQTIEIPDDDIYCSIIDGQHRIEGIKKSGLIEKFELFVEFIFDTDPARDAYLFSIINGNQKPVSKSLIYDLFGVSKARTVEKICNKVMRELNTNEFSKMNGRIKMLGFKDEFSPEGVVSQARLIDELIKHVTDDKDQDNYDIERGNFMRELPPKKYIFREFFLKNDDASIVSENIKFFNSWLNSIKKYKLSSDLTILEKSLGFSAAYRLLKLLYNLSNNYENILDSIIKNFFELTLDKKGFSSSESGIEDLLYYLVKIGIDLDFFKVSYLENFYSYSRIKIINNIVF